MKLPASDRCWPLLWSLPLLIEKVLPIRAQLLGLDRYRVDGALEWRQEPARQYQQTR